ncbi:MAG TPA: aquaporin [Candidatus Paceibacterota bacterium]
MKKYLAEFIGTFALTLAVILSVKGGLIATPIIAGLVLALFVYSIGNISGAHLNPAVTIGAFSIGKISLVKTNFYLISQFLGAGGAMFVAYLFSIPLPVTVTNLSWLAFSAEIVGAFFFTFGIASVVYSKTPHDASGAVIGGSLLLGITVASLLGSSGIVNPAVALGLNAFNFAYLFGPIVGSIIGMNTYKYLAEN